MEDRQPTFWGVIWMIVALTGMVAIILGHKHHILTLVIGTIMLIINEYADNYKQDKR